MPGSPWTKPFNWTEEVVEKVIHLWSVKELTGSEIAGVIGVTRAMVMGKLNRLGLMNTGRGSSSTRSTKVREMKQQRSKEIAERRAAAKQEKAERHDVAPVTVPPPPLPEPRSSHWTGLAAEIDVIGPLECRWPLGEPYEPATVLCKAKVKGCGPYCSYHSTRAYKHPNAPKEWYEENGKRFGR
jgi:GcrA cell cycle regulator